MGEGSFVCEEEVLLLRPAAAGCVRLGPIVAAGLTLDFSKCEGEKSQS